MMRFVKQANFARAVAVAFGIAAVVALGFLSNGQDGAAAATTHTVFVNNSAFCGSAGPLCSQPYSIQIATGDTVQWLDGQASLTHTVTQCAGNNTGCPGGSPGFDSGAKSDPTPNYLSQAFPTAGTFFYRCQIHTFMLGIITVGAASVGGTADFPDIDQSPTDVSGSSGSSSLALSALVSGLVATLAVLAAGAWYARRRWLKTQ